jgi:hypothetical protein
MEKLGSSELTYCGNAKGRRRQNERRKWRRKRLL